MQPKSVVRPFIALSVILGFVIMSMGKTIAQDVPIAHSASDLYHGETPSSKSDLDYRPMDAILQSVVFVVGPSTREAAGELSLASGTRVQMGNPSRTRYEGNRVFYHLLTDQQMEAISNFRKDLEAIPGWIDMARLSKNAQLAYWLNLHNITVIEQIAKRYPVTDIERLRDNGLWDEKLLTVNNIPLSLNDIEHTVLAHWDDPLVMYGLFQGSIGGPNIRARAFRGATVMGMLKSNARDFVNSLRGVQFWGDTAKISVMYDRFADKFPGPDYIRAHMVEYGNGEVGQRLREAAKIEIDVNDEHIADMYNGKLGGNSVNTNAAAALGMEDINEVSFGGDSGMTDASGASISNAEGMGASIFGSIGASSSGSDHSAATGSWPPHVIEFMVEIARRNKLRETSVTIEDVDDTEDENE